MTRVTGILGTIQGVGALNPGVSDNASRKETAMTAFTKALLGRVNSYTLWAFNPQQELTSRYDRAA